MPSSPSTLPIELGQYPTTISYWLKKSFQRESSLFLFISFITYLFASFLLFGTIPVMVALLAKPLQESMSHYQRFLASAIVRGYTLVLLWAPGAVIMVLVLQATGVSWFQLFVPGVLLSCIGLVTSHLLERFTHEDRPPLPQTPDIAADSALTADANRKTVHILLVVTGLIGATALLDICHIGVGTERVLLAGLLVAGSWLFAYRKHEKLATAFQIYWNDGITKTIDLAAFFITMGIFAGAIDSSGILMQVQPLLQYWTNQLGYFSLIVIPVLFILIAIAGVHPFLLVIMFGKTLTGLALPVPTLNLALILMVASSISFITSPFAGMILTISKFLNVKSTDVVFRWNIAFSLIFFVEGLLFAFFWG